MKKRFFYFLLIILCLWATSAFAESDDVKKLDGTWVLDPVTEDQEKLLENLQKIELTFSVEDQTVTGILGEKESSNNIQVTNESDKKVIVAFEGKEEKLIITFMSDDHISSHEYACGGEFDPAGIQTEITKKQMD